jgi:hypothetical protein
MTSSRKESYYFGHLITEIEVFAFPRVGSHYFAYCLSGLFDLLGQRGEHLHNKEAISRQDEINETVLYQLDLREGGVPYQPLAADHVATGVHGLPRLGDKRLIILVRDPISTLYSLFCVTQTRWGGAGPLAPWLEREFGQYCAFYDRGFKVLEQAAGQALLVRYEALKAAPDALDQVVRFVGHRPKLRPDFVHTILRFKNFAREGRRTFYREGKNEAWLQDNAFCEAVLQLPNRDFAAWGYQNMTDYKAAAARRSAS